jgi:hypothetical protein
LGTQVGTLSSSELQALATADIEGAVSNARLQQLLTDHPADITRMLTSLCERGLLVSDNRRRWTTYELSRRGGKPSLFDTEDGSQLSGDSGQLSKNLGQLAGDATQLSGKSGELAEDSVGKARDSIGRPADSSHLPADSSHLAEVVETQELRRLAEPVACAGKVPVAVVRATILQLCAGRSLTADRLGELLNRNPAGLRNRYLSPMVGEGLLVLKYPAATNRPDQAYTTVGEQ